MMWERHQYDQTLDREQLIPHLIIDHDMCDHPGLLYRASDEELATIHRRDHGEEPVAQGLFQWIHTPLPPHPLGKG